MPDGAITTPTPTPGTLILVVGPSGAGKDTLIDHARTAFADTPILFARRIVTRPSSEAERHDTLDPAAFEQADAQGAFAFRWQAHGLHYAIPIAIETVLQSGGSVVCNVSRGVIGDLRARYPRVCVLYVDAPLAIRLARIAGRDRPSELPDRGRREQAFTPAQADVIIDNGGDIAQAAAAFVSAIGEAAGPRGVGLPLAHNSSRLLSDD